MKVWNGSAFVDPSSFKVWNGTTFVDVELYSWNGTDYDKVWPTVTDHVEYVSSRGVQVSGTSGLTDLICPIPADTSIGDRVFMFLYSHETGVPSAATGWTTVLPWTQVGSGTPAATSGPRFMAVFYRDRDTSWSAPNFIDNTSRATHLITLRRSAPDAAWATPTVSGKAEDWVTGSLFSASTSNFTTHNGGYLMAGAVWNDATLAAASGRSLSQGGEELLRSALGSSAGTGSSSSWGIGAYTFFGPVENGATAPISLSFSYASGSSQGGFFAVEQALQ
ncbi:hypothetical protein I5H21_gp024 [Mycobacterium phage Byougenkin]|uniref:Uncharacterized protein n=1 Tax=Mycobacterium phage Byougenkin TaxID=2182394 RepID=A0A2U8UMX3_9CAUD|nr:hypothetical protein I5H21_gp024 [Mycobacterium phage Byougenkin]AWN04948.1 hypothetical protein SEA_BYOUGENKIN_24 [Mycobacterium phage Byougenkin]